MRQRMAVAEVQAHAAEADFRNLKAALSKDTRLNLSSFLRHGRMAAAGR
jgi:hypothetical protein